MAPSDQEALASAKSVKISQDKRFSSVILTLVIGTVISFLFPPAIICVFIGLIILHRIKCSECEPHEHILRQYAENRKWHYPALTELRQVHGQKRRVRFYGSASLLSINDIANRLIENDFEQRAPQPTGEVPRKSPRSERSSTLGKVSQISLSDVAPPDIQAIGWKLTPAIVPSLTSPTSSTQMDRNPSAPFEQDSSASEEKANAAPGISTNGSLRNCEIIKDVFISLNRIEADILRMVQAGATLADVQHRFRMISMDAEYAGQIISKVRQHLFDCIKAMAAKGMTREEIIEKIRPHVDISPSDFQGIIFQDAQRATSQLKKTPQRRKTRTSSETNTQSIADLFPAPEGGRRPKTNYAVVRSAKLRKAAILIHGQNCSVCGFNFDKAFGENLAQGYIEVHHLNSIAAGVRHTDPATDLAPLCSNCHAMADRLTRHHTSPPKSIDELRKLLSH